MNELIVIGNIYDPQNINCSNGRVYDGGGNISPTITAEGGLICKIEKNQKESVPFAGS